MRIACSKCNARIGWKGIVHWLNSAADPLVCGSCNRTIASEVELLGFYLLVGALSALGLFYLDEFSNFLLGFGLDIPGLILALGITALSMSVMLLVVIAVLYIRNFRRQKLTAKQWVWVIALAILVIAIRELSSGVYFTVLNILILVYAIFLSFFIYAEKFSFLLGIACIGAGALAHWLELDLAVSSGSCSAAYVGEIISYLREVDMCIDYTEGWVLVAQALIISGFIVVISSTFKKISKLYQFFKYEY